MRRILAVTSGRADASPMRPVLEAMSRAGLSVTHCDTEPLYRDERPLVRLSESVTFIDGHLEGLHWPWPDLVLLLGDRYEILAAALAATVAKIPIAHIHGGEASFGSFDNQIRDAITKLAHVHFVANKNAMTRLHVGLGEQIHRIIVVGAPGLDNIVPIMAEEWEAQKTFVVTYHPETLGDDAGAAAMVEALKQFPDYKVMWTGTNNDPGSREIYHLLEKAFNGVTLMSDDGYLRAVRDCAAVVGNSSSGIIEAPYLGTPTVNIGTRQSGRIMGASIRTAFDPDAASIARTIKWAINYTGPYDNPYGEPGASAKIADILADIEIGMVKSW